MEEYNAPDDFEASPRITLYPCILNPDILEEVPCIYCKGFKHGQCAVLQEYITSNKHKGGNYEH